MVTLSQHLITLAGYRILAKVANAVDLCGAMISTPNVVEPHSVRLGGDAFASVWNAKENNFCGMIGSIALFRSPHR